MAAAELRCQRGLPAIAALPLMMRRAEAQQNENCETARPSARCWAGKVDGMKMLAEALERSI